MFKDSPGVPLSSTGLDLFRGFSFVAPMIISDTIHNASAAANNTNATNSTNTTIVSSSSSSSSVTTLSNYNTASAARQQQQAINNSSSNNTIRPDMPPPPVPLQLDSNKNKPDAADLAKGLQAIEDNLRRITLIKTVRFEDEYTLKEVCVYMFPSLMFTF